MIRAGAAVVVGIAATLLALPGQASAEPVDSATYAIGKCFLAGDAPAVKPARFAYNCDETGVMQDMTWSSWGPDGANGTGTDNAIECQPNCAQGTRLINPIVVHAWNPQSPSTPGLRFGRSLDDRNRGRA